MTRKRLCFRSHLNPSIRLSVKKELKLPFPEEVRLIKSTIKEEGGAGGYTRDTYIVLIDRLLEHPEYVTKLLAHEAFHVLTRNNPDFRKKMYSIIGFNILPKEIEFPEELKERFISNPDVIRHDSYATFTINGEKKDCCMVIYSTKPYEGVQLLPIPQYWPRSHRQEYLQSD